MGSPNFTIRQIFEEFIIGRGGGKGPSEEGAVGSNSSNCFTERLVHLKMIKVRVLASYQFSKIFPRVKICLVPEFPIISSFLLLWFE